MTDKEILKQIKGADKVKPYAVDHQAIRRGKANLALMMTLTTADHYDWFIGKFPAHNYFEYYGYRVYRRNVYQEPLAIPQAEITKLDSLNRQLEKLQQKYTSTFPVVPFDYQKELVERIHFLTPLMLAAASDLTKKRMHYIGEICNAEDILLQDVDLVKLYSIANHCADDEEAIERIFADFNIPQQTFRTVAIDERTHWGMASCPEAEYPFVPDDQQEQILFKDHQCILGRVSVDNKSATLTPHSEWVKGQHEHHGVDLTIPFIKPYPLWNLPAIQERKDRVVILTDNLYLAYQKQCTIDKKVKDIVEREWLQHDRSTLYNNHNPWECDFEKELREEVQRRTKAEYEQIKKQEGCLLTFNRVSSQDIAWITARLLYLHEPVYAAGSQPAFPITQGRGCHQNLIHVCNKAIGQIGINKTAEKIFENIRELAFQYTTINDAPREQIYENLGSNATGYLDKVYTTLCDVINEWQNEDRIKFEKIKNDERKAQACCWSSWFGGDDALADVNWRELRKRDIVYVLTDEEEHSFKTALKVYVNTKRICSSIRFVIKNAIKSAQEFLDLALNKWNMSPEKLDSKKEYASMFETFDPNAALPPLQEYIIDPIISEKSITLMYAPTGIGKTWFSMCIALAASNGKPLFSNTKTSWLAPKPRRVVYIDSEMTEYHFKKRLQILSQMYQSDHQNLSFKLVADENMNLADEESGYCDQISQWLNDEAEAGRPVDLLILDNLSTLTGFNDSAKSWNTLFSWMKTLKEKRKHPCSVLVVHHSNKKGDQRGTSAKTATVDNVIKLEAQECTTANSVAFEVTVEKGRDIENIPAPFTVELQLPARGNAKPVFRVVGLNKDQNTRSDEAVLYLTGKKIPPHAVIATLTGTSPDYVRQLNFKLKRKKE